MADDKFILLSVDIGNDKIAMLTASKRNNKLCITENAIVPSAGIKKGKIYSEKDLSNAISIVLKDIIDKLNTNLYGCSVNYLGVNIECFNNNGRIGIKNIVTEKDIENVLFSAKVIKTKINQSMLHEEISKNFIVDETQLIDNPIAIKASVLEAQVHIVLADSDVIKNTENILKNNDLNINNIVLDSIAISDAILTTEEKNKGVCLIDFGAETTKFSIFKDEGVLYSNILSIGCNEVIEDISFAFDTTFEEAKKLKIDYGYAKTDEVIDEFLLKFRKKIDLNIYYLSNLMLAEIIQSSYLKILSAIKDDLNDNKIIIDNLKAGFVLSGGGAQIEGFEKLVRSFFYKRAKIGLIKESIISGPDSIINDYRYTGVISILAFADKAFVESEIKTKTKILDKVKDKVKDAFN